MSAAKIIAFLTSVGVISTNGPLLVSAEITTSNIFQECIQYTK